MRAPQFHTIQGRRISTETQPPVAEDSGARGPWIGATSHPTSRLLGPRSNARSIATWPGCAAVQHPASIDRRHAVRRIRSAAQVAQYFTQINTYYVVERITLSLQRDPATLGKIYIVSPPRVRWFRLSAFAKWTMIRSRRLFFISHQCNSPRSPSASISQTASRWEQLPLPFRKPRRHFPHRRQPSRRHSRATRRPSRYSDHRPFR